MTLLTCQSSRKQVVAQIGWSMPPTSNLSCNESVC